MFSQFRTTPTFSSVFASFRRFKHEYTPRFKEVKKAQKGRVSVRTGGSIKGNSLEFGKIGLRLKTEGMKMSANQLKAADKVLRREIRPTKSQLFTRFVCDLAVCIKGNQTRMGKGKGAFDHWAARVPTGKVLFEIDGPIHDKVAREALRKAADKLPGLYEVITPETKVRVSMTHLIDKPEPVNYVEKFNANPSKKWAAVQAFRNDPMYKLYRGR
ncbi:MRPL16 54S ribosomal protein L16 [Candida maltosa Xu316]|uniref:60s ribosomal protein L16, mitochondrial, putative n=1 Tax=Candida maltosa (strain Xu316) TaxID=1245528 RepID=M3IWN9_CANMX|nr:60s ribosomal protein L16, mitochondrial, putative [Candida maltosa Xu316]